jgi:excisionase family DNA binding protein
MSDLARALLDELAGDPVAVERLRKLAAPLERDPALLTVAAAAKMLGCSTKTVRRRIDEGELAGVVEHGAGRPRTMLRSEDVRGYVESLDRRGAPRPRARRAPGRRGGSLDFLREDG